MNHKILTSSAGFVSEFIRCCEEYDQLRMYVAWVGNPRSFIPFRYLAKLQSLHVVVGVSMAQSSPDGIQKLMAFDPYLRIAKDKPLFHPKVYVFSKGQDIALLIGSTNLSYSGFHKNIEVNILIESTLDSVDIKQHLDVFRSWETDHYSFQATKSWLSMYRKRYNQRQQRMAGAGISDESSMENEFADNFSWITHTSWDVYFTQIEPLLNRQIAGQLIPWTEKLRLLELYKDTFQVPWTIELFDSLENRRMLNGIKSYAWLGHVGASGHIQHLLTNGTAREKQMIVNSMNTILQMPLPLNWHLLHQHLQSLVGLGSTMKVWGRFLAISRPDVFATIASDSVRSRLSATINIHIDGVATVDGYIQLIQVIHASPWYNSLEPVEGIERDVWENRVALLDVLLY